jgi:hypothetical protein
MLTWGLCVGVDAAGWLSSRACSANASVRGIPPRLLAASAIAAAHATPTPAAIALSLACRTADGMDEIRLCRRCLGALSSVQHPAEAPRRVPSVWVAPRSKHLFRMAITPPRC